MSTTVQITLPDLGSPRVTLSLWYVGLGERIHEGDRIVEVLFPGATYDVGAPATGILRERLGFSGDSLHVGQVLGIIEADEG